MKKGIKDLIIFGTVVTLMTTTGLALKKQINNEVKHYENPKNKQEESISDVRLSMALTHNDGTITYLVESDTYDFSEHNKKFIEENRDNIVKMEHFDKEGNKIEIKWPKEKEAEENENFAPTLASVVTNDDGSIDFLVVGNNEMLNDDYSIAITDEMEKVEYFDEFGNKMEISINPTKTKTR